MDLYESKVLAVTPLENHVYLFRVERPEGVTFRAGGHMHVGLPGFLKDGERHKEFVHHMTILSDPDDDVLEFITRIPAENPSPFKQVLAGIRPGDSVTLFKFASILNLQDHPMVFLTMGVGLSTTYSLLKAYAKTDRAQRFISLQVGREPLLRKEMEEASSGSAVLLYAEHREDFREEEEKLFADAELSSGGYFYIIGKDDFLVEQVRRCLAHGIPKERICLDKSGEKAAPIFEQAEGSSVQ